MTEENYAHVKQEIRQEGIFYTIPIPVSCKKFSFLVLFYLFVAIALLVKGWWPDYPEVSNTSPRRLTPVTWREPNFRYGMVTDLVCRLRIELKK